MNFKKILTYTALTGFITGFAAVGANASDVAGDSKADRMEAPHNYDSDFETLDSNRDGLVSAEEANTDDMMKTEDFTVADSNQDGSIDLDEYSRYRDGSPAAGFPSYSDDNENPQMDNIDNPQSEEMQ